MTPLAMFLAVGAGSGLIIALVQKTLWNKSSRRLRHAETNFLRAVRELIPSSKIFIMGGTVVWTTTATDLERDRLRQDTGLREQFCTVLRESGYPTTDLPFIQFMFESQETVDRDFKGSWRRRKYAWHRNGE